MPDDEVLGQMRQLSRQNLRLIWETSGLDETKLRRLGAPGKKPKRSRRRRS